MQTGRLNGMVQDSQGTLWVAESQNPPSLLNVDLDGSVEVVLIEGGGVEFMFPNDLMFGPDGALHMTDSGVHRPSFHAARKAGRNDYPIDRKLFRIDLSAMSASMLDDGLQFANGLAFGIDEAARRRGVVCNRDRFRTGLPIRMEK